MSTYEECLASFTAWPHTSPKPEQLARAGLSHLPTNEHPDNVVCKTCDHCICDWEPDDDPDIELHITHLRCSMLWIPTSEKKLSIKDIGFFDPSLQYDFPDLCLFQNIHVFCDRIKRLRFFETDILDLLPKCLRGEALEWFNQSAHEDLAVCLGAMRARFAQAPPEAPPKATQAPLEGPPEGPPEAPLEASQAPPQAHPEAVPQLIDYHHCKLCNASFSSIARLIRHTQEDICNKPSCRHCEKVFSSRNLLHRHLREECQKWTRSSSASSSRSSSRSSSKSSPSPPSACSPPCSPISSPPPTPRIPSPPPNYRAISPPPPTYLTVADLSARYARPAYLKVDDLFRMFGGSSATPKSSITIATDDPFIRPFVFKKSKRSTQKWELEMATSRHQITQAQCSAPRSICEHCRRPPLLEHQYRQEATRPKMV